MKIAVRILVFVFVACAVLVIALSCKTTKVATETKSMIETHQKNDIAESEVYKKTCIDSNSQKTLTNKKDSVHKSSVTVELSKPDSLGNQYPTQITYSDEDAISTVASANNTNLFSNKTEIKNKEKTDKTESKSKSKDKTKATENAVYRPHNWLIAAIVIMILGLIIYYKYK